jgi:hypothetical protein
VSEQSKTTTERIDTVDDLEVTVHYVMHAPSKSIYDSKEYEIYAGFADEIVVPLSLAKRIKSEVGLDLRHDDFRCAAEVRVVDEESSDSQ